MSMSNIQPFSFQAKLADQIVTALRDKQAFLVKDPAGYGKTYTACFAIKKLKDEGFFDGLYLWPVVWVTKANPVEQTKRVIKDFKLQDTVRLVTNYDQFRSSFGEQFITGQWETEHGQEIYRYHWSPIICNAVKLFILDECQALKNESAEQTKIFQALIDYLASPSAQKAGADKNLRFLFLSATPFTRLSEAKIWVTATGVPVNFGWVKVPCTSKEWPSFINEIAGNTNPTDYNKAACGRLMEYMDGYHGHTKYQDVQKSFGLLGRKLYHAENSTLLIGFRSVAQKLHYDNAWARYLEELAKIDKDAPGGLAQVFVAILKFRMAAEECKAEDIAEAMWDSVQQGKSAIGAFNFKKGIGMAVKYLVDKKGVAREDISIIWGGIQDLEDESEYLELGPQSKKARQREIDRFQKDKSHYCFYTFKSGGVGLSLHQHEPEMRQRNVFITPTYSAIELVQGLGRAPRITSWSNTPQVMIFYKDTIEEQVAAKVEQKMTCLREVVNAKESWSDVMIPRDDKSLESLRNKLLTTMSEVDDEQMDGVYIEEEIDV